MSRTTEPCSHRWRELALSQSLALIFMAACLWWVYRDFVLVVGTSRVTAAQAWTQGSQSVLAGRVAGFAFAVFSVHFAFGFLNWGLALLSRAALAFRGSPARVPILIVGWTLLNTLLILAVNAQWYPASRFANQESQLPDDSLGWEPVTVMLVSAVLGILTLVVMAIRKAKPRLPIRLRSLLVVVLAAVAITAIPVLDVARSHAGPTTTSPHIVILGVDSLRSDLTEVSEGRALTPNIDDFLRAAHRFSDAVSPLARTYPAWVSILTGRHPVSTNARFNLMPRNLVHEGDTLADALRARGYRSVYATDEVRFANLDETYGFDQLITPPMGASDFLLGTFGDLPLVNLLAGSGIGSQLFPSIHANRAAYVTYKPEHFLSRLDRELKIAGPSFLAIHLTLAHWPYSWAGRTKPTTPQAWRPAYRHAIEQVDGQFKDVLRLLERKGVLENAIVVVLSDHGDALGYPSDSMLRETGTHREIWDSLWGHGTSVMSPHQYGVLLAMRAFGRANLPGAPGTYDWPVTLEDVRPTLEELVIGRAPGDVDGIPLVPYLADPARSATLDSRIRFTETCFNSVKLMEGNFDVSDVAAESVDFFQIVPESGWVQLRPDRLGEVMSKKQRAALSRDALLAAIPSWTDETVTYVYSSRRSPLPSRLSGHPDPRTDPEKARLWAALQARFPGELPVAH
jgi:hypothetical protein